MVEKYILSQMNEQNKPEFWIFVGPNGSGKSTMTERFSREPEFPSLYVNADDIKKRLSLSDVAAQQYAQTLCQNALKAHASFAFETVGSHESKAQLMQTAKDQGYHVRLFFVCTQDPQINLRRIEKRVEKGGHNVPHDKVISRYERSMRLLQEEFKIAHEAHVFNNSWEKPLLIAHKVSDNEIYILPPDPEITGSLWTREKIEALLGMSSQTPPLMRISGLKQKTFGFLF